MQKKFTLALVALCLSIAAFAQNLTLEDINIRDPYILPQAEEGVEPIDTFVSKLNKHQIDFLIEE